MKRARGGANKAINRRFKEARLRLEGPRGKLRFSRKIGESHSNVSRYEAGRTLPAHVLARVVTAYGLNPDWLLAGKGEMLHETEAGRIRELALNVSPASNSGVRFSELNDFVVLPLLRDPTAAGPGRRITDHDVEGPAVIHRAWCPHPEKTDYVRVKGDSMQPAIPDGSIVTIDKTYLKPEELVHKVVAIYIGTTEEVTLRRLHRDDVNPSRFIGVPDNPSASNRPHVIEDGDRIIGRVVSVHALVD